MWKFVTRGIRETLERRASCRTNVYSQTSPDSNGSANNEVKPNLVKNQKFLAPSVASCKNGFFGSAKSGGPKDKKGDSKWDAGRSWSEAVGWSSVLAIGWVVCQSLCLRRRLFERSADDKWHSRLLRYHGVRIPATLIDSFHLNPQCVLPVTNCVARQSAERSDSSQEWTEQRVYGPITIEEALKEAKDDYTRTHRFVMGEFELRFGVKALEEKRYKDALKHFSTGASLSSSGSMFNLGLCHELGIGTATNPVKAVKYYKDAAEKGHPDAMYNLGVFHAQGRGGLAIDVGKARQLFTEAANLGQTQARLALDLEKNMSDLSKKDETPERVKSNFGRTEKMSNKRSMSTLLKLTGFRKSATTDEVEDSSIESSYCDESFEAVKNPTDIFLNSLGIRTNQVPIIVSSSDSTVPYYT